MYNIINVVVIWKKNGIHCPYSSEFSLLHTFDIFLCLERCSCLDTKAYKRNELKYVDPKLRENQ